MIFKTKKETKEKSRIEKRVEKLPTQELMTWVDQVLYSTGRNMSDWQKSYNNHYLEEARTGAEALLAITNCLLERNHK